MLMIWFVQKTFFVSSNQKICCVAAHHVDDKLYDEGTIKVG